MSGVKYHVSDFLKDRYPYQAQSGFMSQRARDQGKVQHGLLPGGIDALLRALDDAEMDSSQKEIALKHLIAYSAAAEKKIEFLRKHVVLSLAALLRSNPSPNVEHLTAQLLRSLSVLPQGCHCVIEEGGLSAIVERLADRAAAAEREEARIAAAHVIAQISMSWAGRSWMLGTLADVSCGEMQLLNFNPKMTLSEAQRGDLTDSVLKVLVGVLENDSSSPRMLRFAVQSLAALTMVERGLHGALVAGALRSVHIVLEHFAKDDVWAYADSDVDSDTVLHAATVVWHAGLDEIGKREASELPVVGAIGRLMQSLVRAKSVQKYSLRAALAGAFSALMLYPKMKEAAVVPLTGGAKNAIDAACDLLRASNAVFEQIQRSKKSGDGIPVNSPPIDDLLATMKNCVQALRLVAELPAGRLYLHDALASSEPDLRRQIFASTQWQAEFNVVVY